MVERTTKPNLNGGEVMPDLYGRVDLLKYQTGARLLRNFQPMLGGGVMKSPGARFIHETVQYHRLIPFSSSYNDSHVILAENNRFQFIRFGAITVFPPGYVAHPDSDTTDPDGSAPTAGEIVTLATTYTSLQLAELKWTLSNDILYLFHPEHPPRELRRYGLYDWALVTPSFGPTLAAPANLSAVETQNPAAVQDTTWYYVVAAVDENGIESYASVPDSVTTDMEVARTSFVTLTWDAVAGADHYVVYKGTGGIYGFIGLTEDLTYRDDNFAPNLSQTPQFQNTPFTGAGDYPRVGEFIQQRLGFFSTDNRPQTGWLSQPTDFFNLSRSVPSKTDDAIEFTLVGQKKHTINHVVPFRHLIVFTENAEWLVKPVQGEVLSASTLDPEPASWYGSDPNLSPITIGSRVLFVQSKGKIVRDLGFQENADQLLADDLTVMASHLFKQRTISAWAYADVPYSMVFCTMGVGNEAVVLTYKREQEVWGWSRRATGTDEVPSSFLDVCSVPEIIEDGMYVTVRRWVEGSWQYYVERFETEAISDIEDAFFVDSGLSYDDPYNIDALAISGGALELDIPGHPFAPGDKARLSGITSMTSELDDAYSVNSLWDVVNVAGDIVTLEPPVTPIPADLTEWGGDGVIRKAVTTLAGLGHLEGCTIVALADGNVVEDLVVTAGEITLPFAAGRVHAGLPYTADLETLSLDTSGAEGLRMIKNVVNINLHVVESRGILAGVPGRNLYEVKPRSTEGYYDSNNIMTGTFQVNAPSGYSRDAHIAIQAPYPLPCKITGIAPELEYGRD